MFHGKMSVSLSVSRYDLISVSFSVIFMSELWGDVKLNKWLTDIAVDLQIAQDTLSL